MDVLIANNDCATTLSESDVSFVDVGGGAEVEGFATPKHYTFRLQKGGPTIHWGPVQDLPGWAIPALRKLIEISSLPRNWDSHGAVPVGPRVIADAVSWLNGVLVRDDRPPQIVPMTDGSIQFEWHRNNIDLEVEFHSATHVRAYFEDLETGERWEDDVSTDFRCLMIVLRRVRD